MCAHSIKFLPVVIIGGGDVVNSIISVNQRNIKFYIIIIVIITDTATIHQPGNTVSVAGGDDSDGNELKKTAIQTTSVLLYTGRAGMDSICTVAPFSILDDVTISGS